MNFIILASVIIVAVGLLIAICCFTICRHNYCLASTINNCFTSYFIFDTQAHSTAHLDNSIELKSVTCVKADKLENNENIVTPEDQIAVYSQVFPREIYKNSGNVVQWEIIASQNCMVAIECSNPPLILATHSTICKLLNAEHSLLVPLYICHFS